MNFDADRLSRLSGLGPVESTGVLTESKDEKETNEATLEEAEIEECCGCSGNPDKHVGPGPMVGHGHGHDSTSLTPLYEDETLFMLEAEEEVEEEVEEDVKESAPLTMETLRDTVIELRNEILAEQAEEQLALTEAPARAAIRKEIKALLAEMPADAATNWIYGKKGKPSSNNEKSRATTLLGVGFENSKH
jgi:hypothetical protein